MNFQLNCNEMQKVNIILHATVMEIYVNNYGEEGIEKPYTVYKNINIKNIDKILIKPYKEVHALFIFMKGTEHLHFIFDAQNYENAENLATKLLEKQRLLLGRND
jgi:hypothetical protein